jgi:enoyl-CoA hydratase/carnithine racemase
MPVSDMPTDPVIDEGRQAVSREAKDAVTLTFAGDVATVEIDRPEARNAISRGVINELAAAVEDVRRSPARVLVIRGAGDRSFISGGDVKDFAALRTLPDAAEMSRSMRRVLDSIASLPAVVIAALNGPAFGGGAEVALAADIRIACDDVVIAFNQVRLGIMPAWGGIERLTQLVGRGRATYLLTLGTVLSAGEARTWGLVEECVPRAQFAAAVGVLAARIAEAPKPVLAGMKATMQQAYPAIHNDTAESAVDAFAKAWVSHDHWTAAAALHARLGSATPQEGPGR